MPSSCTKWPKSSESIKYIYIMIQWIIWSFWHPGTWIPGSQIAILVLFLNGGCQHRRKLQKIPKKFTEDNKNPVYWFVKKKIEKLVFFTRSARSVVGLRALHSAQRAFCSAQSKSVKLYLIQRIRFSIYDNLSTDWLCALQKTLHTLCSARGFKHFAHCGWSVVAKNLKS